MKKNKPIIVTFVIILFQLQIILVSAQPIQPYHTNPWYWEYKGEPVLLLGGSNDDNLYQWDGKKLAAHMDQMISFGGNYVRNVMSHRDSGNLFAYEQTNGKFDLDRWNEKYWQRFENFLKLTLERDIIVQVEVWATYDFDGRPPHDGAAIWSNHPFNPANNVNYTDSTSSLSSGFDDHPRLNPFFSTIPVMNNDSQVLKYQKAFVEKILEYTLDYPHVLYCMNNETWVTWEWGEYWVKYIQSQAKTSGKQVETTEMLSRPWGPRFENQLDKPALYTFLDLSQVNSPHAFKTIQEGWNHLIKIRSQLNESCRPYNIVKVYGGQGNLGTVDEGIQKFWRNLIAGCAAVRFHRPSAGIGLNDLAQANLRSARMLTAEVNVFDMVPNDEILGDRSDNEAYCLAQPGRQYAVYFPNGGEVSLTVTNAKGQLTIRWLDINNSKWMEQTKSYVGETIQLKAPGSGHWAAVVLVK